MPLLCDLCMPGRPYDSIDLIDTKTYLAEVAQGANSNYGNKNVFNFQIWLNQEKLDPEKWIKK